MWIQSEARDADGFRFYLKDPIYVCSEGRIIFTKSVKDRDEVPYAYCGKVMVPNQEDLPDLIELFDLKVRLLEGHKTPQKWIYPFRLLAPIPNNGYLKHSGYGYKPRVDYITFSDGKRITV
jgi:hypothetical protein